MDAAWVALALSLKVAGWATALNLLLGLGAGYALARLRFPGRELLDSLLTLPMVLPPTVLGYYLLVLWGKQGWLGQWLHQWLGVQLIFTRSAAIMAATVVTFPLIMKAARTALEQVPAPLENAGRVLGLGEWAVFWRISLPLAWRGILAGSLLALARALGEFGATLMVAGSIAGQTQTLSIAIYEAVQAGQDDAAHLMVLVISATCVALLLLARRLAPERL